MGEKLTEGSRLLTLPEDFFAEEDSPSSEEERSEGARLDEGSGLLHLADDSFDGVAAGSEEAGRGYENTEGMQEQPLPAKLLRNLERARTHYQKNLASNSKTLAYRA